MKRRTRITATANPKRRRRARRRPADASRPTLAATERAGLYRLPYGRWKGFSIAQVAERDASYLRWAGRAWAGRLGLVVREYLAGLDAPEKEG